MSDYNPTNPAFDAILNLEMIKGKMKPKELDSESMPKGLVSKRSANINVSEAKKDGRLQIVKYIEILKKIREENRKE
tara:strand:+ start:551 stop:781 length:231 start_codon:yes stop_codon:yes gene_type:complete